MNNEVGYDLVMKKEYNSLVETIKSFIEKVILVQTYCR
jgi:hypothetical protein